MSATNRDDPGAADSTWPISDLCPIATWEEIQRRELDDVDVCRECRIVHECGLDCAAEARA